jgi:hypothetical protein
MNLRHTSFNTLEKDFLKSSVRLSYVSREVDDETNRSTDASLDG